MTVKIKKKLINLSKRKFNSFLLYNFIFFFFFKNSFAKESNLKKIKKIRHNDFVWYLNASD